MENFNPGKRESHEKKSSMDKVSNFFKATVLSKLLNSSKMDKTLADNLYANRILEEELIAPDKTFSGFTPSFPEGSKVIDFYGALFVNIGDKMYYIMDHKNGFYLVDNTSDFIPKENFSRNYNKKRAVFQKKYGLSTTTKATHHNEIYRFNQSVDDGLDNWIIHNDMEKINKNSLNKDATWWLKGQPYKGIKKRSLLDKPEGRHLFAKQSALEASIGRPLDEHQELSGNVLKKGSVQNGAITITPTSEADLPKIGGLKSFTYNPITKSMERGIFDNSDTQKTKDHLIQEIEDKKEDEDHQVLNL